MKSLSRLMVPALAMAALMGSQLVQARELPDFTQLVTVSLSYRKVTWEHAVAGTSGADDWRSPIEA